MSEPDSDIMDPWQIKRGKRIKYVRELLKEMGRTKKKILLGHLGSKGVRRNTAEDYLRDLIDCGLIKEEKDELIWIGDRQENKTEGVEGETLNNNQ